MTECIFINTPKSSLKAVLLHNGNELPSVSVAHSWHMKETYENFETLLKSINYGKYKWSVCGDLKVIRLILGLQSGYIKYGCFLCMWDSRAKDQFTHKHWDPRPKPTVGQYNIKNSAFVEPAKILLPPLHIKLGLMKNFVRALKTDKPCIPLHSRKVS